MGTLNKKKIEQARPGFHGDGGGLYLSVQPSGKGRSWIQRLQRNGVRRDFGLGPWPEVSLDDARAKCLANRKRAYEEGTIARVTVLTFEGAAKKFYEETKDTRKAEANEGRWLQGIESYAFPAFGKKPVEKVTREDLLTMLGKIWKKKNPTAKKLRARCRAILQWCVGHGLIKENVAGSMIDGALPVGNGGNKPEGHRSLPYAEVPGALELIRTGGRVSKAVRLCMEFLILTATRSSEARGARWEEIDLAKKAWIIPASRMKTNVEHRIPLSSATWSILEEARTLDDNSGLIFPSPTKAGQVLTDIGFKNLLKGVGLYRLTVPHGFRSSRSERGQRKPGNADHAVKELCLAHAVGSKVERAYNRTDLLDRRRVLMARWSEFVTNAKPAKVVNLR